MHDLLAAQEGWGVAHGDQRWTREESATDLRAGLEKLKAEQKRLRG